MKAVISRSSIFRHQSVSNFGTLSFNRFGFPSEVLSMCKTPTSSDAQILGAEQVKVSIKTSQVRPEDIRTIRGISFASKSTGNAGTTAVGVVREVAKGETDLAVNDTVLIVEPGVWTDQAVVRKSNVSKIAKLPVEEAATLPSYLSAWAMFHKFVNLSKGDTVIQSSGHTADGMAISQVGKALGYNVLSPTAAELSDAKFVSNMKAQNTPIKLSISDRSGKTSLDFARITANNGTVVVYNGTIESLEQSQGIDQSAGSAIYNNVSVVGFDFGQWHRITKADGTFQKALSEVVSLGTSNKLNLKPKSYAEADFQKAIADVQNTGSAAILKF